jgi:hypothetical protein
MAKSFLKEVVMTETINTLILLGLFAGMIHVGYWIATNHKRKSRPFLRQDHESVHKNTP